MTGGWRQAGSWWLAVSQEDVEKGKRRDREERTSSADPYSRVKKGMLIHQLVNDVVTLEARAGLHGGACVCMMECAWPEAHTINMTTGQNMHADRRTYETSALEHKWAFGHKETR